MTTIRHPVFRAGFPEAAVLRPWREPDPGLGAQRKKGKGPKGEGGGGGVEFEEVLRDFREFGGVQGRFWWVCRGFETFFLSIGVKVWGDLSQRAQ